MNTEDFNRKKMLVTILTVGSSILLLGLMLTDLYSYFTSKIPIRMGVSLYLIPLLLIGHILFYFLIRKNRIVAVSFALSLLYSIGSIYGAYKWGISMPTALLLFSLVIGLLGMIFSSRVAFVTTIISFGIIFLLGIREIHNPGITSWKSHNIKIVDIVSYIVIIGISSGLTILSNSEIEKSLKRARESEKNLEQKVENRTQELRKSQYQTISAMSQAYELGKVAQGLFHDLITPLTSAALYVSEYDRTNTKLYLEKAVTASDRMRRMLDVTKDQIRQQKQEIFNAKDEIETTKDLLQYAARKKQVTIDIKTENDLLLQGLPIHFSQVISNIVQNAIEAFDKFEENKIIITIKDKTIEIMNNGPEIPYHLIPGLFTSKFTTKKDHSGIGLSTVYTVMKDHFDGNIEVSTSPEKTIFNLTFPNGTISPPLPPKLQKHSV